MLSSQQLKAIVTEARPLIEQQLDLTEQVAGLREVVTAAGGDWSQLKALVKAQIQDERDEAGDGKRVRKILDKADYAQGYADMLGLAKMNEKNSFADLSPEDRARRSRMRLSESMLDNIALSAGMLRDGLITEAQHAENVALSNGVARKLGAGVINPDTGEIDDTPPEPHSPSDRPPVDVAADAEKTLPPSVSSEPIQLAEDGSRPAGASGGVEPEGGAPAGGAPGQDESARIAPDQSTAASHSEPGNGQGGETPLSASAQATEELVEPGSSVVKFPKLKMNPEFFEAPHPACKRPDFCGGNSNLALCQPCREASQGVAVPLMGSIGQ